jgi:Xaa-Pro aminopeptidase
LKSDLDKLMQANQVDVILVTGSARHNPAMYYLTGGAQITNGDVILTRGSEPVLFHSPMEREEAAKSGLRTRNLADFRFGELLRKSDGDYSQAIAMRYEKMLAECGVTSGRLALYGKIDAGYGFAVFSALQCRLPDLDILAEIHNSLLLQAMETKGEDEIRRIRQMGEITVAVVGQVADYLTSMRVKDGLLVKREGSPLTVGEVKNQINLWLAERGAENPEGLIFATGRDAGIPHSTGNAADPLHLGQVIVFDIFPSESGGGYFYDFTRTWCLGYATDEVQAAYQDVSHVYRQIASELKSNTLCQDYQERACELFESRGHPTLRQNECIQAGYVHGLGHGVGLHIHERPWFGYNASAQDVLAPGVVVTIEPGLYYPDRNFGVRLEDTFYITPEGHAEILAEFPLDLVLPIKNVKR